MSRRPSVRLVSFSLVLWGFVRVAVHPVMPRDGLYRHICWMKCWMKERHQRGTKVLAEPNTLLRAIRGQSTSADRLSDALQTGRTLAGRLAQASALLGVDSVRQRSSHSMSSRTRPLNRSPAFPRNGPATRKPALCCGSRPSRIGSKLPLLSPTRVMMNV
jgi:hypothetical protein